MNKIQKDLDYTKKEELITREIYEEKSKTEEIKAKISKAKLLDSNEIELLKANAEKEKQLVIDEVSKMILEIQKLTDEQKLAVETGKSNVRATEYERQMASIQPRLIEAMITLGGVKTTEILAKNLKEQGGNWTDIFRQGGIDGLLATIKGTPLYDNLMENMKKGY